MNNARIKAPGKARLGEIIEIRVLIRHPMETGFRYDDLGQSIPKNVINQLVCRYNGVEVLRTEFSSGIAANPYLSFYATAQESGDIEISWVDDAGNTSSVSTFLEVGA